MGNDINCGCTLLILYCCHFENNGTVLRHTAVYNCDIVVVGEMDSIQISSIHIVLFSHYQLSVSLHNETTLIANPKPTNI